MEFVDSTEVGDANRTLAKPLMTPMSGKGKELCDLLRKELDIPGGVKSFEVRFAVEEPVTVRCEYVPRVQD